MDKFAKYVHRELENELKEFLNSNKKDNYSFLTVEQKVLVYKYTFDDYEVLNEQLRVNKGKEDSEFGKLLDQV